MGRFATNLAAYAANVYNLPPKDNLPQVSFWEALLPGSVSDMFAESKKEKKPLDPNVGMRVKREFYNVGKDGKGKKVMIAHKTGSAAAAEDGMKEYGGKKEGNGNGKGKGKNGGGDKKDNAAGAGGAGEKKVAEAPFTHEDDATLKRMKDEKKSWNEIIEVLGRNKKVLQDRFKEINGGGGNDTKEDENKDNGKKGGNGNGEGKKDKFDNKKESKKQDKKPEPAKPAAVKAGSVAGSNGQARFTMNEWMTLQEDDVFSFGELQCLSELMLRDERHRWTRLASAFYDKTGRRVHPDDIRDKFGEMSAVGSQK